MSVLNDLFKKYGYRIYMCSVDQRYMSFVQEENYYVNVIGFFDERKQTSTRAQMQGFLDAHKERLTYGRPKDIHFLKLICTDARGVGQLVPGTDGGGLSEEEEKEAELTKAWTQDVWYLIDDEKMNPETGRPMGGRLFVPPTAPEDFYGIRKPLEQFVNAEGIQVAMPEINLSEAERTQLGMDKAPATEGPNGKPVLRERFKPREAVCYASLALILINVVVFYLSGRESFVKHDYCLMDGILQNPGEWYRLFTHQFMHADIGHLLNNMLMLFAIGSALEQHIPKWVYAGVYLLAGVGGGIFSVWYHTRQGIPYYSMGASGAVYGLMGAMIAWLLLRRQWNERGLYGRIAFALFLMFYSGTVQENIDQTAHLGGFLCGLILCGIYCICRGTRPVKSGAKS
jgi:rhomboid protease GluP